jgi:hypothetical protein
LKVRQEGARVSIALPEKPPGTIASVLVLETSAKP